MISLKSVSHTESNPLVYSEELRGNKRESAAPGWTHCSDYMDGILKLYATRMPH